MKEKIKQWYWCGVFGELYGSANETRYVNDVVGVMEWIRDGEKVPKTVQESYFNPTRLLSLQTRQSAAYKGILAMILRNRSRDFISGREMDFTAYCSENIDIHHIFPKEYCEACGYPKEKWNSIVNKPRSPTAQTGRSEAPPRADIWERSRRRDRSRRTYWTGIWNRTG